MSTFPAPTGDKLNNATFPEISTYKFVKPPDMDSQLLEESVFPFWIQHQSSMLIVVSMPFLLWMDLTSMISDRMHMSCNQDFKATSPSARQVERAGKYLIPSVANLRIDSFYEGRQTVTPGQEPLKDDTKRRRASFSSGDETVNSHGPVDYADDDNVNSNTPTRRRSKPNPRPVLFSSKSPENSAVKFADRPILKTSVVVYERGRKGRIVKERSVRQGLGRPRKQYQVRWKSWVESSSLTTSSLLRDWKNKAHNPRH